MYIFQLDRFLLAEQIQRYALYISGKVLDVGAGAHNRYKHLFQYDEYIRMDISPHPGIDVIGSAEEIPFPENIFDAIVCTQVLEHVLRPGDIFSEVHRVLKQGGNFLVTVPQASELHEEPRDFQRFTKYWVREMAREHGYAVVVEEARGGFFSLIHQQATRYVIDRFNLYQHRISGRIMSVVFEVTGKIALFLDSLDKSVASTRHAMGWLFILTKQ